MGLSAPSMVLSCLIHPVFPRVVEKGLDMLGANVIEPRGSIHDEAASRPTVLMMSRQRVPISLGRAGGEDRDGYSATDADPVAQDVLGPCFGRLLELIDGLALGDIFDDL